MDEEVKLSIKVPLITDEDLRIIDNNFDSIINRFLETVITNKDLAIAQYIIKKQQEELYKYKCKRNDCGGRIKENNKPTDAEVLENFEKWLIEAYYLYVPEISQNSSIRKIYDKLQEFKGDLKC